VNCILALIPGEPVPFGRPRPTKHGRYINPKRYREWKESAQAHLRLAAHEHGWEPIAGPVGVEISAIFPRPKHRKGSSLEWRPGVPDGDNLEKAAWDAAQGETRKLIAGILFKNDSQVVRWAGTKLYSRDRSTGLYIHVSSLPEKPSVPYGLAFALCTCWEEEHLSESVAYEPSRQDQR
jgi:Holliday junction resolvase RusA-like endonuclease